MTLRRWSKEGKDERWPGFGSATPTPHAVSAVYGRMKQRPWTAVVD